MSIHPLAGKPAPQNLLTDIGKLRDAYFALKPDIRSAGATRKFRHQRSPRLVPAQHLQRGPCAGDLPGDLRLPRQPWHQRPAVPRQGHPRAVRTGFRIALEVLGANGVAVMVDRDDGYTPTPAISHAILTYNRGRTAGLADGIVITPSHNPPEDGGFKYNPPHGGPADTDITRWIEDRANQLLATTSGR